MSTSLKGFGCLLSPVDLRDYRFSKISVLAEQYPSKYELPMDKTKVKNQRTVGSCVAHALSTILEYHDKYREVLSTNFIYGIQYRLYLAKGPGMQLRNALKIAKNYGDMTEEHCQGNTEVEEVYDIASKAFNIKEYRENALRYRINSYVKLNSVNDIKFAIMNYGPVLAGVKWYETTVFNNSTKFITSTKMGGYSYHATVIYGWDENGWLCQNSWGKRWGDEGYYKLHFNDGPREAYSIVDDENNDSVSDIVKPTHNIEVLSKVFKLINNIINKIVKRK